MSSTISKTLVIDTNNCTSYLTAQDSVQIGGESYGYAQVICCGMGVKTGNAVLNSSAMAMLYPNAVAHPSSLYITTPFQISSASGSGYISVAGTNVVSDSKSFTSDYKTTLSATATGSHITGSTRNTTILIHLQKGSATIGYVGFAPGSSITLTTTFTRYDFSASAGSNVTAASVSSSTGYDGDTITYSCTLASGATFEGWYNGSTLVSTSQTYTHTVNGADLSLTAKATGSAEPTKSFSAIYGSSIIISQTQSSNVAVGYNSGTITTLTDNDRIKHLLCKNKLMSTAVTAGGKTLNCGGKVSSYDIPMLYCYGSWELNKALDYPSDGQHTQEGYAITPFIPLPSNCVSCNVSTGYTVGDGSMSGVQEFNSSFQYCGYWGNTNDGVRTIGNPWDGGTNTKWLRMSVKLSKLSDCYIYDNTNGKYLFKGGNV